MSDKTILVIGTYDTKDDELHYLAERIEAQGGGVLSMDVSVLGDPSQPTDIDKHAVAEAGGSTIAALIERGEESHAMQVMALGAAKLAVAGHAAGDCDAVIVVGGSMGTDLALDVCAALPVGVPKYVVSTVSFSPLVQVDRLAPDIQMILWAGGLYGLNSICKSSLSQAAGAVLGAARAVEAPSGERPIVGMTSLGSSCLKYMKTLKPALEARGFEVAVFHATGMGGMAFEQLARQGAFACVMDFCTQELGNYLMGSIINAGPDRLRGAGAAGVPQLVAPGCIDLVDLPTWNIPSRFDDREVHEHNRLISSALLNPEERRQTAREIAERLGEAKAPAHLILPAGGIEEWDRPKQPLHDPDGLAAFVAELQDAVQPETGFTRLDAHINDAAFCEAALAVFDRWVEEGVITGTAG